MLTNDAHLALGGAKQMTMMIHTRASDARDGWYRVTPENASSLLASQPQNRPLVERKAVRFANAMRTGEWRANGEPLILDERDLLLDGQGRLRAIQLFGSAVEMYVIHGIPRKNFPTIDTGSVRSPGDTLALVGAKNCVLVAAVCRWCILLDELGVSGANGAVQMNITNAKINGYYERHGAEINTAITELRNIDPAWTKACQGAITPSAGLYIYMTASRIDAERALLFMIGLITGEGLDRDSPILALRRYKAGVSNSQRYIPMAMGIKAMNAFLKMRPLKMLKWDPARETFPTLGVCK